MSDAKVFKQLLEEIRWQDADLSGKDFLLTWEKTRKELQQVLYTAEALKWLLTDNTSVKCFDPGLAVLQQKEKSPRAFRDRFSFITAANLLGLTVQELSEKGIAREAANTISLLPLTDIIGIRGPLHMGAGSAYMGEMAAALDEEFEKGVLFQRPGIINLQCDKDHPTQAMADLLLLKHHIGSLEKLAGKKIAVIWNYSSHCGAPLSIPQGISGLVTRFGMKVFLAHPAGYHLMPEVIEIAAKNAAESKGSFTMAHSMDEALAGADAVYAANWDSYEIMEKRSALLRENDQNGLRELDRECMAQNANLKDWEGTTEKMKLTGNNKTLFMQGPPADRSTVSFKPFVIAAMILNNRFKEPARVLANLKKQNTKRIHEI